MADREGTAEPPPDASADGGTGSLSWLRGVPTWVVLGGGGLLVVLLVLVAVNWNSGSSDEALPAGDTSSTTIAATSITTPDEGSVDTEGTATSVTSPGDEPEPGESGGGDPGVGGEDPTDDPEGADPGDGFSWPSEIRTAYRYDPGFFTVGYGWIDPSGETHFTYRFTWEGDADSSDDFGELAENTTRYQNVVACEAETEFLLIAWDGDEELGRQAVSGTVPACDPVLPSPLSARTVADGVFIEWEPGSGYSHYAFELTTGDQGSSGYSSSTDTGTLDRLTDEFFIPLRCGRSFLFDLTPIQEDGTALTTRQYGGTTGGCPTFYIVAGPVVDVPAGAGLGSTAVCGANRPVAGGFRVWPDAAAMPYPGWVYINGPDGTGWGAYVKAPPERSLSVQAFAVCSMGGGLDVAPTTARIDVPAGRLRSVVASCPSGTVVVGGGFNATIGFNMLVSMRDDNGWRGTAINELASDGVLDVYAMCAEDRTGDARASDAHRSAQVADGEYGPSVALSCPAGSVLTGGGYSSPDAYFVTSYPIDGDRLEWWVDGFNREFEVGPPGPAVLVQGSGVCVDFPLGW